jgi:DNA replication protein DnaC
MKECPRCSYPIESNECSNCRQQDAAKRKISIQQLGGIRPLEDFTLEAFKPSPAQRAALEAVKVFDPAKDNLFICGPVGAGKSHLAAIASRRFLGRMNIRTLNPFEISRLVRGASNGRDEMEIVRSIADSKILVIDDLGTAKDTEFLVGLLFDIINFRYLHHRGGMIITSNLNLQQLAEKMGEDRVASRLAQLCKTLSLAGEKDHRISNP